MFRTNGRADLPFSTGTCVFVLRFNRSDGLHSSTQVLLSFQEVSIIYYYSVGTLESKLPVDRNF